MNSAYHPFRPGHFDILNLACVLQREMRQEHYQKAEERNVTNGKAEEFTLSGRKPSQDHSTLKQSLDGKAEEEVCAWSHCYQKIRLYGNRRLGLSCSFLQAYNRDTRARLYERESFNPCLQCLSQCRFLNSRSPQAVTTRVMSWD